jgi:hypothetical protein
MRRISVVLIDLKHTYNIKLAMVPYSVEMGATEADHLFNVQERN